MRALLGGLGAWLAPGILARRAMTARRCLPTDGGAMVPNGPPVMRLMGVAIIPDLPRMVDPIRGLQAQMTAEAAGAGAAGQPAGVTS